MKSPLIGSIVMGSIALKGLKIFVSALEHWHPTAKLYIYTDSKTPIPSIKTTCTIYSKVMLDAYSDIDHREAETKEGKTYKLMWADFMYEKANIIQWIFDTEETAKETGVWYMDMDVTHFAPLPTIPKGATLGLSPYNIVDEYIKIFGKYNAGYIWFGNQAILDDWRKAGHTSRFFEQAALEDLVGTNIVYEFPIQVNYGWWHMSHSPLSAHEHIRKISLYRPDTSIGIRYDNKILQSVNTHWNHNVDSEVGYFNKVFLNFINKHRVHKPLVTLHKIISPKKK